MEKLVKQKALRVPEEQYENIERVSELIGISAHEFILLAIDSYIKDNSYLLNTE